MNVAIIPARGGSKRIPRKNIKHFCGKPIIAYSILAAKKSALFDRIIVSTDDQEIADIAEHWGADIPFLRPKELADDHTVTMSVINHAIAWLHANDTVYDYACCIYPTAPLIRTKDLQQGYWQLRQSDKLFAFSVTTFPSSIFRALKRTNTNGLAMFWPEHLNTRSQDLPEAYHDAGQFYWGKTEAFLKGLHMFDEHALPIVLPRFRAQDIDTHEDWQMVEMTYQTIYRGNNDS
jgi:pseudaminic acid cytidylyltransferase